MRWECGENGGGERAEEHLRGRFCIQRKIGLSVCDLFAKRARFIGGKPKRSVTFDCEDQLALLHRGKRMAELHKGVDYALGAQDLEF